MGGGGICENLLIVGLHVNHLTLQMLLSSKAKRSKDFRRSISCCVGIYCMALTECSQMSIHMPGFQSFFFQFFLHHFALAKLATTSIRGSCH